MWQGHSVSLRQVPSPGDAVGHDWSVTLRPDGLPPAVEQLGAVGEGGTEDDVWKVKVKTLEF